MSFLLLFQVFSSNIVKQLKVDKSLNLMFVSINIFSESFGQNYPEENDGTLDCITMAICCQFNRNGTLLAVGCNDGRLDHRQKKDMEALNARWEEENKEGEEPEESEEEDGPMSKS